MTLVWIYAAGDKMKPPESLAVSIKLAKRHVIGATNFVVIGTGTPIDDPDVEWIDQEKLTQEKFLEITGIKRTWAMKQRDQLFRLIRATELPQISDSFLRMYDDHFVLKPATVEALSVPMPDGDERKPGFEVKEGFQEIVRRTLIRLRRHKPKQTSFNFSYHPIVKYEKEKVRAMIEEFNMIDRIALPETIYCNRYYSRDQMGRYSSKVMRNIACEHDWPLEGESIPHYVCTFNRCAKRMFESRIKPYCQSIGLEV